MYKILTLLIISFFVISGNVFAGTFAAGTCPAKLQMTQNLKAPNAGAGYIRNGKYHWYTKSIVREANILQSHLNRLDFNAGKVDGIIGPNTKGAILRMQKFLGTKQDGYVGPKTRALLNNSCGDISNLTEEIKNTISKNYTGKLKIARSESELKKFISDNKEQTQIRADLLFAPSLGFSELKSVEVSKTISGDSVGFSETNIQVSGVDESDIVKTDGKYIYSISNNKKIYITDISDSKNMKKVSEISAGDNESIRSMYLYDKKLIVLSNYYEKSTVATSYSQYDKRMPYYNQKNFSRVEIYNISNPTKPVKEKTIDFEGNSGESRITNDHLYLLTNKYFNNGPIMPLVKIDGKNASARFGSSFYYIDQPTWNNNLLSLSAINLKDTSDISSKRILIPNSGKIYVSKNNFYITHNKYINTNKIYLEIENEVYKKTLESLISKTDKELVEKIKNTDSEVLPEWEKAEKIKRIYGKYQNEISESERKKLEENTKTIVTQKYTEMKKEFSKTLIEKFSLNGTKVGPVASGEVSGNILNQFSMSEIDGNFFIATTNNQIWFPWQLRNALDRRVLESENNLYSLDKNLKNLDSLEGLAKGERIKSVRFVGDNAYLVTFKQTDPLFNIDISSPENMKVLGELKIDGFSSYLHPVFEDRLIGLGRDIYTDKYGNMRNGGIKVSLFDISGKNPKEVESKIIGNVGSYTEASYNHKAVLISDSKGIMAFPATVYTKPNNDYKSRKNVVELLKISRNEISEIAQIENDKDWGSSVKRVLHVGENIFSISNNKIKSSEISNGNEVGKIILDDEKYNKEIIFDLPAIN